MVSVSYATGSFRDAFGSLLAFFVLGTFALTFFDHELGVKQCKQFEANEAKNNAGGAITTVAAAAAPDPSFDTIHGAL